MPEDIFIELNISTEKMSSRVELVTCSKAEVDLSLLIAPVANISIEFPIELIGNSLQQGVSPVRHFFFFNSVQ